MFLQDAQNYLASPALDEHLRQELSPIVLAAKNNEACALAELEDRFSEALSFGTGGLRGKMAAGLRRMNAPNIRRATLALASVAKRYAPQQKTAVIGYDSRLQSADFAREAARVLAAQGYTVYCGERPLPTPFLCFAMRRLHAGCGIIITASHNPKEYNGYKAYNHLGGQVLAPWDSEIEAAMRATPMLPAATDAHRDAFILPIPQDVEEAFYQMSLGVLRHPTPFTAARILFTPLHGTGLALVPECFRRAGLPLAICQGQAAPDGNFPTAPRPNPEEMAAFSFALEDAKNQDCEAILANDPDADRLGVLYRHHGQWCALSGNDMAALALDYLATQGAWDTAFKQPRTVITTVVTSDFLAAVAALHRLPVIRTLTGFKYIGAAMERLHGYGERFAFAAEESIGLLPLDALRDKDGVTAALLLAEMLGFYKAQGKTLGDAVQALQTRTGPYFNRLVNLEDPSHGGAQRFAAAMDNLRKQGLTDFAGEVVAYCDDFQSGQRVDANGQRSLLRDRYDRLDWAVPIEKSNVLKFTFQSGAFAAFRPSGTEPKLKIYLQSHTNPELLQHMEAAARTLLGLDDKK